jgi:hypothetical protein
MAPTPKPLFLRGRPYDFSPKGNHRACGQEPLASGLGMEDSCDDGALFDCGPDIADKVMK